MFATTLKGLLAHKARLAATAIAVVLGVAFMTGTLVLTDTLTSQFDDVVADTTAGTDAHVRRPAAFDAMGRVVRDTVDADLLATVTATDGVEAAAGRLEGWAQVVGADGEVVGGGGLAPTTGANWVTVDALNPYDLTEGSPPGADDQVVVDRGTAEAGDLHVGATTTVLTQAGPVPVTISGIATFGDADSVLGASTVLFTDAAAQRLVGQPGRYDGIDVTAADGVSQDELVSRLTTALQADDEGAIEGTGAGSAPVEVLTGEAYTAESQGDVADDLSTFNAVMLTFAVVSLVVGAFTISNTFSIIVAQRGRELAVLRALGASRRQVTRSVLVESVVIGAVASTVGLAAGVGMAALLRSVLAGVGLDLPDGTLVVSAGSLVTALVVGVAITVASALVPALRAGRVAPVAAMRDVAVDDSGRSGRRTALGLVVLVAGIAALAVGVSGGALALVGLGSVLAFLAVVVLGPVLAQPLSRLLGTPFRAVRGLPASLARDNAGRSPKRTAATASALMIGVGLVAFLAVMGSSLKASLGEAIDGGMRAEYVMSTGTTGMGGGLDASLAGRLAALPGVEAAVPVRLAEALVNGEGRALAGIDMGAAGSVMDLDVERGALADVDAQGIAVSTEVADANGWDLGATVPVTFADGATEALAVRAVFANGDVGGGYIADTTLLDAHGAQPLVREVMVKVADGADPMAVEAALTGALLDQPHAEVLDRDAYVGQQTGPIDQVLGIGYAMLALAVVIGVLGIANTLSLSIVERTRELGLLRAVGMTRAQLRTTVRIEAVIIALLGTVLGVAVGTGLGAAMVRGLASQGIDHLTVPGGQLLAAAVVAAIAGVAAAVLPARRAARTDVLTAIAAP